MPSTHPQQPWQVHLQGLTTGLYKKYRRMKRDVERGVPAYLLWKKQNKDEWQLDELGATVIRMRQQGALLKSHVLRCVLPPLPFDGRREQPHCIAAPCVGSCWGCPTSCGMI